MAAEEHPDIQNDGPSRRSFITRMAAVGAIATPLVSSFAMDGLMSPSAAQAANQSASSSNLPPP